jgi:hypothetical protein
MCGGGGVGSANDSGNDNDSGSGNSFKETLANIFSPGDGMSYVDGRLTDSGRNTYASTAAYKDDSGSTVTPKTSTIYGQDGNAMQIRADTNDMYNSRIGSALLGAATGGIPGLVGNLAINELTKGKTMQGLVGTGSDAASGLKGLFQARGPESMGDTRPKSRLDAQREQQELQAQMGSADDIARNAPTVTTPTVAANSGIVGPSAMSAAAGGGGFQPVPNPNYDPNDPVSQQFLSNPTYAQLLAYRDSQQVPGMAEGGELTVTPPEGGNEKTMISDAVSAVKGEMSEEQSSMVLGQFLANYGEEALRDLVDKVQSGEFDDTVDRFANGEAGEVRGPGDGSGVDDKVPASLEGQQDVLLADGEFVLRKKTADALEKKYGGGFLDAVNKAESTAPKTMQQYMARN